MKKIGLVAGILAAALVAQAGSYNSHRAIVVLKSAGGSGSMKTQANLNAMAVVTASLQSQQVQIQSTLKNLNSLVVNIKDAQDLERIKSNPLVAYVDPDVMLPAPKPVFGVFNYPLSHRVTLQSVSSLSSAGGTPWGIKAIHAPEAWGASKRGQGARVMILDTGIDKDHPALRDNLEVGKDFIQDGNKPYDYFDAVGHGSHVAGTIAGALDSSGFSGVAPSAKLLMGRVCSEEGCSSVAIAEGLNWAIQEKVDAVSMSLGGAMSPPSIRDGVQKADDAGIVVVAASGNDGTPQVGYPAALPTVIAVGAVDASLTRASFSQYGPELAVCAPGVEVVSSLPQGSGRDSVITIKGTNVNLANAPVQGAGEFTGKIEGDLVSAGIGRPEDFKSVDVKGKVALMARGTIPFTDKVINAMHAGAIAILIYNNEPGLVRGGIQPPEPVNVPVFIIEQQPGMDLTKDLQGGKSIRAQMAIEATDYGALDGTSMATPHVSGVVALIRAANKKLTTSQVRDIVKRTATHMQSNSNNECGAGVIDAASAVSAARTASLQPLQ
jgi:serine protease